jgi:ribosomal protein S18 acetylase RimI-like enzyme
LRDSRACARSVVPSRRRRRGISCSKGVWLTLTDNAFWPRHDVCPPLPDHRIRLYCPLDRQAVWTLAADSAFFGRPVEAFLDDRNLYWAFFAAYYTDYEPERLWVAETKDAVAGYVMGCADNRRRMRVAFTRIIPALACGLLRGRYHVGRKTLRDGLRELQERLAGGVPRVALGQFPGHLHINVSAAARGRGLGRALLETSLAQFWETGVVGVHLLTTDHNRAACYLYESVGFHLLGARRTSRWRGLVAGEVQNRVYGIKPEWQPERSRPEV